MPPAPRASRTKQRAFALLERASLAGALVAIMFAPSLAMAAEPLCRHPLAGASCAGVFSLVSLVYTTITATYTAGALLILRGQMEPSRFKIALLAALPFSWLTCMLAFTIGGFAGVLTYPHDTTPFFFMDWFVATFLLIAQVLYVIAAVKLGKVDDEPDTEPIAG
ncbi:MAG: hypothetical protein VYE40_02480 [Myxococcota bacterium]|jgi:uncharacterized membrane protein YbhN (UPF0104 family)|nr:hypothetical protein [Myxococcota bacterium]MEC9439949.1 hypothetical protein [Myxococcota bacterium]